MFESFNSTLKTIDKVSCLGTSLIIPFIISVGLFLDNPSERTSRLKLGLAISATVKMKHPAMAKYPVLLHFVQLYRPQ